jgi:predicted nuclease of predicted toxin-antitoxin system
MKFLANENFPLDSVKYLREKKFDVLAIGTDYQGISDEEIIRLAQDENRIILTFDRDYGELIFKYHLHPKAGIIYLRLNKYKSDEPGKLIENLIQFSGFDTTNKLTVYDGRLIRQRVY